MPALSNRTNVILQFAHGQGLQWIVRHTPKVGGVGLIQGLQGERGRQSLVYSAQVQLHREEAVGGILGLNLPAVAW